MNEEVETELLLHSELQSRPEAIVGLAQAERQLPQQEAEEHPRYRQLRLQEAQGVQVHEEVQVLLLRSELLLRLGLAQANRNLHQQTLSQQDAE